MFYARFSSLLVALLLGAPLAAADEAGKPAVSPELQKLIQQLDADVFSDRMRACEQLFKLGKDALPGLEVGVQSDSPEQATRSFELLQQLFEKGDGATKLAAKASLEKLAAGSDRAAIQSKKLLEPKPVAVNPNLQFGGARVLGGGMRVIGPRIARAVPIAPGIEAGVAHKRMTISTSLAADGTRTINVDEDGKKFKAVIDSKQTIEGEYIEIKDGKEATVKFAAKDADELKTKHPDAFKLYERFAKGGDAVRVAAPEGFAAALRRESPAELAPQPAPATRERFEELLKTLDEQIAKTTKELAAAKADKDPRADVLTAVLESYGRLRDRYKVQLKELEAKELDAPKKPVAPKEPAEIEIERK